MQKVNVTMTDEIPPELIAKMEQMGIDTSKIQLKTDDGKSVPINQMAKGKASNGPVKATANTKTFVKSKIVTIEEPAKAKSGALSMTKSKTV